MSEKLQEERRIEPANIFSNTCTCTSIHALPVQFLKTISCVNDMLSVPISKGAVSEGLTVMLFRCTGSLDSVHAKSNVWHKCWSILSQLTNHRVYQELVYQNEVMKAMLTGSTTPSFSSLHMVFAQLPHYLGDWDRLIIMLLPLNSTGKIEHLLCSQVKCTVLIQ